MADNHVREDASAGEDGGIFSVDAVTEGAADSVYQMDPAVPSNGPELDSSHNEPKETRAAEDGVREDMFVDCPDEIETSESQQSSEEKDNLQNDQTNESDSGIKVQEVVAEIELLRDKLDKSVSEKDHLAQEYEEERAMFMRELSHLCNQLKVSSEQLISADENAYGFINRHEAEVGSSTSLHDMISECSRFLKYAVVGRLQTEEKVRELHSVLYVKDQEIDFLNAKVADLTESSNISQSNSISEHDKLSQLYEVQLEKDQHIEEITNRILASLTTVHHQEELWDGSLTEKISNIDKSVTFLVERYNLFVSESGQLKECLNEAGLDLDKIDEVGTFLMARDRILEHRRKEDDTYKKLSSLEDENKKLVEEFEKQKSTLENMKAEIRRLNAEVEQERNRYANTKEKLSMAVTKGKALVQQRDSLKQSLLEKTSQLEKCSFDLQEKTSALDDVEKTKELFAASEKLAAFLQDSLAEKEMILQKCGEILLESFTTNELQTTDITEKLKWLADENKSLNDISLQYHKLSDALLLFDFPETVGSSELDVRVHWLAESLNLFKEEAARLQSEIIETKEAAKKEIEHLTTSLLAEIQDRRYLEVELEDIRSKGEVHERLQQELVQARESVKNEIDRLTSLLSAESQEKSNLLMELENLRHKYEGVIEKESLASSEKDKIMSMLLEASGLAKDSQGEVHPENSDTGTIIDNCLKKIRGHAFPTELSPAQIEIFESLKSLLYIRDQEMTLYKLIIEEDILDSARAGHLSDELDMRTRELGTLKDEKAVMQKSLEQLEERCALLKEKLSMAVKKGKGLVQDRENLKGSLNEKNTEIDSLKSELQQHISRYAECQDQITKLLVDVERISLLETGLTSTKERADQLEQFLSESNNMLQRVMESIEAITTPANLFLNDPVEKVKWISGYISENEILKTQMEQELRNVKDEVSSLASKLSEVQMAVKSLEDALSITENSRSELLDEKKALEVSKALLEEELQKEKESALSHTSEFEELLVRKRALEDALSLAEDNASRFTSERDAAVDGRSFAEEQIKKLTEELSDHITKFADAEKTIQSLEDALSLARKNISILSDESSKVQIGQADLEGEITRIREEADTYASKLSSASTTIKSLEDALSLAEDNASRFTSERDTAVEGRAFAEEQIKKLTEELSVHITKFTDAEKTIQSLEDALSQAKKNISVLSDESSKVQIGQADLEGEITRIREEADTYASKLSNASTTIKSFEDALLNAENNIAELVQEKKNAEQETMALTSKLESCMEELAGTRSSIENQSLVLSDQLSRLQSLLKDESLSTLVGQCFLKKFETIKSIEFLLKEMWDCFLDMDSDVLQNSLVMEDGSLSTTLPFNSDVAANMEKLNDEVNVVDTESILVHFEKIVERFHLKGKTLADKFDHLSTLADESIAILLRRLHVTKEKIINAVKYTSSLEDQLKDFQTDKKRQDDTIASLESDVRILLSACIDATQGLEMNVHKNVSDLRSIHELVNQDGGMSMDLGAVEDDAASAHSTDHVKKAEKLLLATRQNQDLSKLFQDALSKLVSMTEDMHNKLKETQLIYDEVLEERDLYKDKILKLETDLIAQRKLYNEMEIKLEEYILREDVFRKGEAELSTSSSKVQELEDTLSPSQVKSILDKINQVNIPDAALAHGDSHDSANARKLFYVIDSFIESLNMVNSLSHENEELQSTIDQQILEIEQLRRQVEDYMDNEKGSEKLNNLSELESGLQIIVQKLGGGDLMYDSKVDGQTWLMPLLDKLVTARLMESETLKLKNGELSDELLGAQKAVDDLSNKVKLLEEYNQNRVVLPEIDQEREASISSLSTQPEISEMHEMGALGKSNNIPSVSSAAHARTLRKGSSDHLAINIESESERLLNDKGSDEDKGHVFKSLIGTGLIPRQGRTVADRIDGVWVSSSRALMKHPRGRLGIVVYWLVLHIWLLGSIL
ncbi:hypothetical protein ACS0TY_011015 [Phlomoides rotata]